MWHNEREGTSPLQACGRGGYPRIVVSPTGRWIALHKRVATESRTISASDIWLCDLQRRARQIASQTPVGADEATLVSNSVPSWSPDGTKLTWAELTPDSHRLIVYDLETETAEVIVDELPESIILADEVAWGNTGILVEHRSPPDETHQPRVPQPAIYTPDGEIVARLPPSHRYLIPFWVVDRDGNEYVGRVPWLIPELLDPRTNKVYTASEGIELYSLLAPEDSLTVVIIPDYDAEGPWWVSTPDGELIETGFAPYMIPVPSRSVAISPSGDTIAFAAHGGGVAREYSEDAVYLWRDGEITEIRGTRGWMGEGSSLLWGPVGYRARGELIEVPQ